METEVNKDKDENRRLYWLITFVSFVACIALLYFMPAFFWITLPFLFTFFVKAIGMM
jgi:fatty acid desaturase